MGTTPTFFQGKLEVTFTRFSMDWEFTIYGTLRSISSSIISPTAFWHKSRIWALKIQIFFLTGQKCIFFRHSHFTTWTKWNSIGNKKNRQIEISEKSVEFARWSWERRLVSGWSNNDGSRHFRVHESMKNGCNVLGANFSSGFLLTGKNNERTKKTSSSSSACNAAVKRFIHIFDG